MEADLITQRALSAVIGQTRVQRLMACGWLQPIERRPGRILFARRDEHRALSRAERERCPANKLESIRVRALQPYRRKERPKALSLDEVQFDFSAIEVT
jgi:hypothetical protein